MVQVRWIGDWVDAVDALVARPELMATLRTIDDDTDALLKSLASALEGLIALQQQGGLAVAGSKVGVEGLTRALHGVLGLIFDIARTRGKIEGWYSSVTNPDAVAAAKRLIATMRKLEFFSTHQSEIRRLEGTISWLSTDVVGGLKRRIADLERPLGLRGGRLRLRKLDPAAFRVAKKVDLHDPATAERANDSARSVPSGARTAEAPAAARSRPAALAEVDANRRDGSVMMLVTWRNRPVPSSISSLSTTAVTTN